MIQIKQEELPRIFAAYWGAEVTGFFNSEFVTGFFNSGFVDADFIKSASRAHQILLKNLSHISDEDIHELVHLRHVHTFALKYVSIDIYNIIRLNDKIEVYFHTEPKSPTITLTSIKLNSKLLTQMEVDFLRSSTRPDGTLKPSYNCGYGIYSPQDLVDAGVVKTV